MRNFFIGISMLVLTNLAFAQQYNQQDAYCARSAIIIEELLNCNWNLKFKNNIKVMKKSTHVCSD